VPARIDEGVRPELADSLQLTIVQAWIAYGASIRAMQERVAEEIAAVEAQIAERHRARRGLGCVAADAADDEAEHAHE
jgi:hypothetical protein